MALQTKTFTWGSYKWQSESNAYVIELVLTENKILADVNKSEISYKLTLKSGSSNRFDDDVTSTLKLNGVTVATKKENRYLDFNSQWELLSGTTTVAHNADGTLTMPIEVTIDSDKNENKYAPPDKTLTWSWELTTIPRASSITSAAAVTLGNSCNVQWTPNSSAFRFKLIFSLKDKNWTYTTNAIHPNKTSAYTYTGYKLPLDDIAKQLTDSNKGTMVAELITYSDSTCANEIGRKSKEFTVTVPGNDNTKPTVNMTLEPVNKPVNNLVNNPVNDLEKYLRGLYLQRLSKVSVKINATAKLEAKIQKYTLSIGDKTYEYTVDKANAITLPPITATGKIKITGSAVDSRGITGKTETTITVYPYSMPKLTGVKAYRCKSDGTAADDGECLKIEATRVYAKVMVNGAQKNFCEIRFQYKKESDAVHNPSDVILVGDAETDTVSVIVMENALDKELAWNIRVIARDYAGQDGYATVLIPSERVFMHKKAGGRGMGLGGYCQSDNLLDVYWDLNVHGEIKEKGKNLFDLIYPVGSIYISVNSTNPANLFGGKWERLKDRFLLAAGDTYVGGATGGEATHKLTVAEMPAHKHEMRPMVQGYSGWPEETTSMYSVIHSVSGGDYHDPDTTLDVSTVYGGVTGETGAGTAHNNMPPYLAVYMYKRTE